MSAMWIYTAKLNYTGLSHCVLDSRKYLSFAGRDCLSRSFDLLCAKLPVYLNSCID